MTGQAEMDAMRAPAMVDLLDLGSAARPRNPTAPGGGIASPPLEEPETFILIFTDMQG